MYYNKLKYYKLIQIIKVITNFFKVNDFISRDLKY